MKPDTAIDVLSEVKKKVVCEAFNKEQITALDLWLTVIMDRILIQMEVK